MKRKLKWLAVVLAVVLLAGGAALFLSPRDRISAESFWTISLGMQVNDAEEILGGPGIALKDGEDLFDLLKGKPQLLFENKNFVHDGSLGIGNKSTKVWFGRRGIMTIEFDQGGRVIWKYFQGVRPAEPSFLERVRDWLGL